jgi:hypothetical protein
LRVLSALEIPSGWADVVQAYETLKTSLGIDPSWRSSPFRLFLVEDMDNQWLGCYGQS